MPVLFALPYLLIEMAAFIAVVQWLGLGPALGLLFLFFIVGLLLAAVEMRRISRAAASQMSTGKGDPGAIAGNFGLTAFGAVLVAMPGFISSIVGLLLMIAPTRALLRGLLAKRLRKTIEDIGIRSFESVNGYRTQASYGSFGGFAPGDPGAGPGAGPHRGDPTVIDAEEIQEWTSTVTPEDFGTPGGPGENPDDPDRGERK